VTSANSRSSDRLPIDAATRGKMRVLLKGIDDWAQAVERAYEDKATQKAVGDFALRKGKGRARAFKRLQKLLGDAVLWMRHGDAVAWLYMRRIDRADTGVELCSIRVSPGGGCRFSFPVEFTEHALARVVQRGGNPIDAMLHAGLSVVGLSVAAIHKSERCRIAAGDGAFAFDLLPGPLLRASTWMRNDQLSDRQGLQIIPLGERGDRLVDHFTDEWRRRIVA